LALKNVSQKSNGNSNNVVEFPGASQEFAMAA